MKKFIFIFLILIMVFGIVDYAYAQRSDRGNDKPDRSNDKSNTREQKQKIMEQKEKFMEQKRQLMEKRDSYMETKKNVMDLKKSIKEACKTAPNNENCKIKKRELKQNAKPHLLRSIETMIKILENLKTRVESSDMENKAAITDKINAKISKFNELKTKAEAINENTTNEEIKSLAKQIKDEWKGFGKEIKMHSNRVINDKFAGVLNKAEKLEIKLDRMLAKLKSQGYDTSLVESDIAKFKDNIKLARENFEKAKAKYQDADKNNANYDALVKEAHDLIVTAHNNLKDAQHNLRDIITKLKQSRQGQDAIKDIENEEETTSTTLQESTTTTQAQVTTTTLAETTTTTVTQ